jgi:hypothetical protein
MSNIRQRRAPSPSRDNYAQSSTSWGIATENSGDNAHSSARSSIPMYNPMTMQSSSSKSSTPSSSVHSTTSKISHRTSWNTITEAKKSNAHDNSLAITYHDSPGYYTDSVTGKGRSAYDSLRSGRNLPSMSNVLIGTNNRKWEQICSKQTHDCKDYWLFFDSRVHFPHIRRNTHRYTTYVFAGDLN